MSQSELKRLQKKQRRKQALLLKSEPHLGASFQDHPTPHVFIANGGMKNGVSYTLLKQLLGDVSELHMPQEKDYALVSFPASEAAAMTVELLNGACVQDLCREKQLLSLLSPVVARGPPLHLYLFYLDKVPVEFLPDWPGKKDKSTTLPPGLILLMDYLSLTEEAQLLEFFSLPQSVNAYHDDTDSSGILGADESQSSAASTTREDTSSIKSITVASGLSSQALSAPGMNFEPSGATLRHRKVQHYGYEFLYGSSNVNPNAPLPGGLPDICLPILRRLVTDKLIPVLPDQLTVNEYPPGAGIPPHIDTHSAFEDGIISITLGSQAVMDFRHPDGLRVSILLQRRSVLVMTGESRYLWTHGIPSRKSDVISPTMPGYQPPNGGASCVAGAVSEEPTVLDRGTRVSLTFRKIRTRPCTCSYPLQCDSQKRKLTQ